MEKQLKIEKLVAVLIFSLLAPFTTAHAAPQVVYLAYQGPLTGSEALIGVDQSDGVSWAIKTFNSSQSNYEVRLIKIDDQGDPSVAGPVSAAAAAKNEIIGLVGPAYSGAALASFPAYKSAGLAMISPSATRDSLTDPTSSTFGGPVFFRLASLNQTVSEVTVEYAIKGFKFPKVFILDDKSAYGTSSINSAKNVIRNTYGAQLVGTDSIPETAVDLSDIIGKIKSSSPDVIVYFGYQNLAVKVLKVLRSSGMNMLFAGSDALFSSDFPNQAGSAGEGVRIITTPGLSEANPGAENKYRIEMGRASGYFAIGSIDATNIFLQGIKVGNTTRSSMLRWVKGYSGVGIAGNLLKFSSNGDVVDHGLAGYVVENQKFVYKEMLGNTASITTPAPTPTPTLIPSPSPSATSINQPTPSQTPEATPSATPTSTSPKVAEPISRPSSGNTSVPPAPISPKYSIAGKLVLLSVTVPTKVGAKATGAYLIAPSLGINKTNRILGEVSNGSAIFTLDINNSMLGKTSAVSIYLTNEIGESRPLNGSVKVPGAASKPVAQKPTATVICQKGNLMRTFMAKTCPPGWKKS